MVQFCIIDMFHIHGQGTVFTGIVTTGEIAAGDHLRILSPLRHAGIVVRGLERDRQLISRAGQGESLAMMVQPFDLDPVSDGFRRLETGGYEIISLKLVERPKKRWEIWRF